jgi:hypothetical protein
MWRTVLRYIASFKGDVDLLNETCSKQHHFAHVHSPLLFLHQIIMSIDITSMEVWKN